MVLTGFVETTSAIRLLFTDGTLSLAVPAAFVTSTKLVAVTPAFPMAAHVQAGAAPRGRQRGIVSALQRTVPVQMWAGAAQSRGRCGRGEPSPGADVGVPLVGSSIRPIPSHPSPTWLYDVSGGPTGGAGAQRRRLRDRARRDVRVRRRHEHRRAEALDALDELEGGRQIRVYSGVLRE